MLQALNALARSQRKCCDLIYARVSTAKHSLERQLEALAAGGIH
jgi:predicted site-specific integrase-resolvase